RSAQDTNAGGLRGLSATQGFSDQGLLISDCGLRIFQSRAIKGGSAIRNLKSAIKICKQNMQAKEIVVPTSSISMLRKPDPLSDTLMTVSLGPQHPSTHGVLRLELVLDGETVIKAIPDIGYLHTGIEKTMEREKWQQVVTVTCRADYLNSMG